MVFIALLSYGINYYKNRSDNNRVGVSQKVIKNIHTEQLQATLKILKANSLNTNSQFWVGFNARVVQILKDQVSQSFGIHFLAPYNFNWVPQVTWINDLMNLSDQSEWKKQGGVIYWTQDDLKISNSYGLIIANGKT